MNEEIIYQLAKAENERLTSKVAHTLNEGERLTAQLSAATDALDTIRCYFGRFTPFATKDGRETWLHDFIQKALSAPASQDGESEMAQHYLETERQRIASLTTQHDATLARVKELEEDGKLLDWLEAQGAFRFGRLVCVPEGIRQNTVRLDIGLSLGPDNPRKYPSTSLRAAIRTAMTETGGKADKQITESREAVDALGGVSNLHLTPETGVHSIPTGAEAQVCEDIAARQRNGIAKYGTTVADNPAHLREWMQHLYEELLDAAIYTKRAMTETGGGE